MNRLSLFVMAPLVLTVPQVHADESAPLYRDPSAPIDARVADLIGRMTLDEKIGQMTQAAIDFAKPADVRNAQLGSVLSGGDEVPVPATAENWATLYDDLQRAALSTRLGIPILFGIDAVHGHDYVYGATIFPHNIGLGATRDQSLVERIGHATAVEMAATGMDWTYSPCVAVTRDNHWGRVYESFGEVPELPTMMTSLISGLQGTRLSDSTSIMATAKHYIGDGGTNGGVNEGEMSVSEPELRALYLPPYQEAVRRNVSAVMISYSSWNGVKAHANRYLISDVLKSELGFQGIVMTDWDGIERLDGSYGYSAYDVRTSINAGIDLVMAVKDYYWFAQLVRQEVANGGISIDRINDATRRILRKKFEKGVFEQPFADRSLLAQVGSAEHRALAREAVQKSQVVLKNEGGILPLRRDSARIFVAGKSAHNIGLQSGGWTIQWQGGDGAITPGTTILDGILESVEPSTTVSFDARGDGADRSYDVAIAVVGERPYAESEGDRTNEGLRLDEEDRAVLAKLKATGVPVVVVLVSGRPLDIHEELPDWQGLVASWLPGTEGGGVADVLFGRVSPSGKLPVTWAVSAQDEPVNVGDGKASLFPFGFGLSYPAVPGL
jgi:beta-glucosidase